MITLAKLLFQSLFIFVYHNSEVYFELWTFVQLLISLIFRQTADVLEASSK